MTDRYASAGVSLATGEEAKRRIAELVRATRTPLARGAVGGFGGMVRVPEGYRKPLLVMSTDGVGSKVLVAAAAGIHDTVGEDLVNHSVNDILVHGATPLFFLDYIAMGTLDPKRVEEIVRGLARGCREVGCALIGGETAEMPGIYAGEDYDLAGAIVGLAEESAWIDGSTIAPGDVLLGLPSTGLHTNGYSLARKILFETLHLRVKDRLPWGAPVGQELLKPHRYYGPAVAVARAAFGRRRRTLSAAPGLDPG